MNLEDWKISTGTLSNGLQIWYKNLPTATASIGLLLDAGSKRDGGTPGIAHFTEHMLFQGTKTLPGEQIKILAAENGIKINAATSKEYLMVTTDAVLLEKTPVALEIIKTIVSEPNFDPLSFERERKVVLSEINDKEDKSLDKAFEIAFANLCAHPYKTPVLGYKDTVLGIKREDMISFHRNLYVPNNATLCYAGPQEFDSIVDLCKAIFGDWQKKDIALQFPVYTGNILNDTNLSRDGFNQTAVAIAFPGTKTNSPDEVAIDVMADIIGGSSMISRMFRKLRNEMSLCYYCGAMATTLKDENGLIVFCGSTSPDNASKFTDGIMGIINNIQGISPATSQELQISKTRTLSILASELDDLSSYMSIFSYLWTAKAPNKLQETIKRIQMLSLEDIHACTKKYLNVPPTVIKVGKAEISIPFTFDMEMGSPTIDRPSPAPSSHASKPTSTPRPFATGDTSNIAPIQTDDAGKKDPKRSDRTSDEDEEARSMPDAEPTCTPKISKVCKRCQKDFECLDGAVVSVCPTCKLQDIVGTDHPVDQVTINSKEKIQLLLNIGEKHIKATISIDASDGDTTVQAKPQNPTYKDYGSSAEDFSRPTRRPPPEGSSERPSKTNDTSNQSPPEPEYGEGELKRQAEMEAVGAERNEGKHVYIAPGEHPEDSDETEQPRDDLGRFMDK